MKAVRKILEGK